MKKICLLFAVCSAVFMVSCNGIGDASLSKKDVLEHIISTRGTYVNTITLPEMIKSRKIMESNYCNYDLLTLYANNGLVTMRDTTISYREWGKWKSYAAVDCKLTPKGQESVLESVISSNNSDTKVLRFEAEYDKIVDMRLISRVKVEESEGEILKYIVFYTGTVIKTTPFITIFNVNEGDVYPIVEGIDEEVIATIATATFRKGKLINLALDSTEFVDKSDMDSAYDEVWLNEAKRNSRY